MLARVRMEVTVPRNSIVELARVRRLTRTGEARRIRLRYGLSLTEIANAVGVSPGAISRWEHGQRRPTGDHALVYADLLDQLEREV